MSKLIGEPPGVLSQYILTRVGHMLAKKRAELTARRYFQNNSSITTPSDSQGQDNQIQK